jgi:hypothetical protein
VEFEADAHAARELPLLRMTRVEAAPSKAAPVEPALSDRATPALSTQELATQELATQEPAAQEPATQKSAAGEPPADPLPHQPSEVTAAAPASQRLDQLLADLMRAGTSATSGPSEENNQADDLPGHELVAEDKPTPDQLAEHKPVVHQPTVHQPTEHQPIQDEQTPQRRLENESTAHHRAETSHVPVTPEMNLRGRSSQTVSNACTPTVVFDPSPRNGEPLPSAEPDLPDQTATANFSPAPFEGLTNLDLSDSSADDERSPGEVPGEVVGNIHETASDFQEADPPDPYAEWMAEHRFGALPYWLRGRRLRTTVALATAAAMGLLMAGYGALWAGGRSADFLSLAAVLPEAMVPATAQPAAAVPEEVPADFDRAAQALPGQSTGQDRAREARYDAGVRQAAAEQPVAPSGAAAGVPPEPGSAARSAGDADLPWPATPLMEIYQDPQLCDLDDLLAAREKATAARDALLAGNLNQAEQIARKGKAYMAFCELARCMTMLEPMQISSAVVLQQSLSRELIRSTLEVPENRRNLAQIASRWWEYRDRPVAGFVFVGTVLDIRARGRWTEYSMGISWGGKGIEIPVLMDRLRFSTGDEVAMVGVIVTSPKDRLTGYDQEIPQIVLAGYGFPLQATVRSEQTSELIQQATAHLLGN